MYSFGSLFFSWVKISPESRGAPFSNRELVVISADWSDVIRNHRTFFFVTVELLELRREPFTPYHLLRMRDDLGNCWQDLGLALGIKLRILRNLEYDCRTNKDRANQVLYIWMDENGRGATVGCLACTLIQIGQKRIADILLGM